MADLLLGMVAMLMIGAMAGWSASEWRQEREEDREWAEREMRDA